MISHNHILHRMKSIKIINRYLFIITFIAVILILSSFVSCMPANKNEVSGKGFAVVELFTSEGCSSCPPADAVAAKLAQEYKDNVYVLGFHVDYWDRLGWKDVFSNSDFSKRQYHYGQIFHLNSVYTPQVIINGRTEFVGSNEAKLRNAITQELNNTPEKNIELTAKDNNDVVTVSYKVDTASNTVLNIALIQLQAQSNVKRGENEGRTLHHIDVVRDFKTVNADKNAKGNVDIILPETLSVKDCRIIAYLQNNDNWQIIAAAETGIQ
jgi:hypothetical protein